MCRGELQWRHLLLSRPGGACSWKTIFSGFTGNRLSDCDALHTFGHPPANTNVLFEGFYSGGFLHFTTENQSKLIPCCLSFMTVTNSSKKTSFLSRLDFFTSVGLTLEKRKQHCSLCWKHKGSFHECWHCYSLPPKLQEKAALGMFRPCQLKGFAGV